MGWGGRAAGALDVCVPYSRRARAGHSGGAQTDGRARPVKNKIPAKRKRSVQRGADADCVAAPSSPLPSATVDPRDTTVRTHGQGANRAARTKNPLATNLLVVCNHSRHTTTRNSFLRFRADQSRNNRPPVWSVSVQPSSDPAFLALLPKVLSMGYFLEIIRWTLSRPLLRGCTDTAWPAPSPCDWKCARMGMHRCRGQIGQYAMKSRRISAQPSMSATFHQI